MTADTNEQDKTAVPLVDALRAFAEVTSPGDRRKTLVRAVEELEGLCALSVRFGELLNDRDRRVADLLVERTRLRALLTELRECEGVQNWYAHDDVFHGMLARIDAALDGEVSS